jgi:lysozyme
MARLINQAGVTLLTKFEGYRTIPYRDGGGVLTVGIGHTGVDVLPGIPWTDNEIKAAFDDDVLHFEQSVESLAEVELSDNQFAALVCFAYNVGLSALAESTLLRKLNESNFRGAAAEFVRWDKIAGQESAGLRSRREAEAKLFNTP